MARKASRTGSDQFGFTIVELLIVIVVIAILAAITIVAYNGITQNAKKSAASSAAQQAGKKIVAYALQNGDQYPASLAPLGFTDSGDTSYQYTPNQVGGNYCVTVTVGGISSSVGGFSNEVNQATPGPCPGHTGMAPTTLDDGSSCPAGYIVVPGNSTFGTKSFCVMKYEAKNVGGVATSQAAGTPWVSISQTSALSTAAAACAGCHLITEAEWMTIAANVLSVPSNWSGNAVGSGFIYSGHNDNSPANALAATTNDSDGYNGTGNATGSNQRRTLTLTNGAVIWDLAGNVYEWTDATISGAQPGGSGYAWRQYPGLSSLHTLPSASRPSAIPGASGWSSTQGIGQLYSNADESGVRAFLRGGTWTADSGAGVLALTLSGTPSGSGANLGFRVAK
ncbi:SUMF1/EgtB/PvdO family nonheme iron enzyme [uncultured Microbacterium sp.]|uniref:SUMF1/EgtB/PvdO family nonheme iron enzyme n=1 Tax=uncultured Microbacterium sp. TaxID=191216 RepID=UPI0026339861|nr:SUMF1/EgtB/PvdO family nonheme iron enzyme [uncultured Microbacterium sp.]